MKCKNCDENAVITDPALCKEHYIDWFEEKVLQTIGEYSLLQQAQRIAVAASGGKDSTSILYILKKNGYDVEALAVDEGIPMYRDRTLDDLRIFCKEHGITLKIVSFKEELGSTLMENANKLEGAPCRACGIMRRHLLNKHAKEYDAIVTGHNLDDEFQSIMMSMLKGNISLALRSGPKSGINHYSAFTQRVKPLYFITEKQVLVYSRLKGFAITFGECPNALAGYRTLIRNRMIGLESNVPGIRANTVKSLMKIKSSINTHNKTIIGRCDVCNGASNSSVCAACRTKKEVFSSPSS
jgi:tRNA-5-methyluridine54 2-sulfurtransferase